ncbi:hypothetical protein DPMN_151771 [Dreissena polymorpha]|uniref:Uncharacterized protein n=1 Tax=Dreissena polymorpha TaxID=45954 RepID=A0A9D4FKM3_DREPO|nr:hypothetical protein DPMN_151771 [Dreissena polymorpha]
MAICKQHIIGTNVLTKFHECWTINVTSRVFTGKNAPTPGCHVFQHTRTIFKLIQDHKNKFYDQVSKKVAPPGGHVFQPTGAIFVLVQNIIGKKSPDHVS